MTGLFIGTVGWSIPARYTDRFPHAGTHLARYGSRLDAVEINSSFYRPHRPATYARWAASVPDRFRFAVKLPKAITHERCLDECEALLDRFAGEVSGLGDKLGMLLVQLPPSLAFNTKIAPAFLAALRARIAAQAACEPRHASWFTPEAERCLVEAGVARVAADPPPVPGADMPGGWRGIIYLRLHGSPRIYYSTYGAAALEGLRERLARARAAGTPAWCIFDNTAAFHALGNALSLREALRDHGPNTSAR